MTSKTDVVGQATGLAWTSVGGDTLFIEVALTPGKGAVKLTGKLGDVMKESAQTAYTYVKANAGTFGISPTKLQKLIFTSMFQKERCPKMDHLPASQWPQQSFLHLPIFRCEKRWQWREKWPWEDEYFALAGSKKEPGCTPRGHNNRHYSPIKWARLRRNPRLRA